MVVPPIKNSETPFEVEDIDDAEYDQELGKQMGKDAQRVADGDMSQSEFYEKYHERVLEEFGEDQRDPGLEGDADE